MNHYVEIVEDTDPERVVKRMGPMSERRAEKAEAGANINLNHVCFYTRVVPEKRLEQCAYMFSRAMGWLGKD